MTLNTDKSGGRKERGKEGGREESRLYYDSTAVLFRLIVFYGSLSFFFFFLGTTQIRPQLPHSINKAEIYLTELNEVIVKLNYSLCT